MEFKIKNISVTDIKSDILIINLFENTMLPGGATGAVDNELSGVISNFVIKKEGFNGQFGKMYVLPVPNHKNLTKVLIVGLGKRDDFNLNKLRELCSKVIQKIKTMDNVKAANEKLASVAAKVEEEKKAPAKAEEKKEEVKTDK